MGRSGDGKRNILLGRPYLRATPDSRTKNFYKAVPDNKKMAINSVWHILQFKLCLFNLHLSTKIACSSLRDSRVCRKHEHENKMGGNWGESFSRHRPLFPDLALILSRAFPLSVIPTISEPDDENRCVYKCRLSLALFHSADMFINKLKTKLNDFLQNDFKYKKNSQLLLKKCPRKSISSLGAKGFFFLFLTR